MADAISSLNVRKRGSATLGTAVTSSARGGVGLSRGAAEAGEDSSTGTSSSCGFSKGAPFSTSCVSKEGAPCFCVSLCGSCMINEKFLFLVHLMRVVVYPCELRNQDRRA